MMPKANAATDPNKKQVKPVVATSATTPATLDVNKAASTGQLKLVDNTAAKLAAEQEKLKQALAAQNAQRPATLSAPIPLPPTPVNPLKEGKWGTASQASTAGQAAAARKAAEEAQNAPPAATKAPTALTVGDQALSDAQRVQAEIEAARAAAGLPPSSPATPSDDVVSQDAVYNVDRVRAAIEAAQGRERNRQREADVEAGWDSSVDKEDKERWAADAAIGGAGNGLREIAEDIAEYEAEHPFEDEARELQGGVNEPRAYIRHFQPSAAGGKEEDLRYREAVAGLSSSAMSASEQAQQHLADVLARDPMLAEKYGLGGVATYGGAQYDTQTQQQFRDIQQQTINQLLNAPSIAQQEADRAREAAMAQQFAASRSGRGQGNLAASQRLMGTNVAQTNQTIARDASIAAAQENLARQQAAAGIAGTARGMDIGVAGTEAGLAQQAGLFSAEQRNQAAEAELAAQIQQEQFNTQAQIAQTAQQDQLRSALTAQQLGYEGIGVDVLGQQRASDIALANQVEADQLIREGYDVQRYAADAGVRAAEASQPSWGQTLVGGGMNILGSALGGWLASDKNVKKGIKSTSPKDINSFLDALESYDYSYKRGDTSPKTGVMAQDLEKSSIGKKLVSEDPMSGTKMVDTRSATLTMMGALSELHKRQKAIEAELRSLGGLKPANKGRR